MDMIEKVSRAISAAQGGCNRDGFHLSECAHMIAGENCECADLARAAIEATGIERLRAVNEDMLVQLKNCVWLLADIQDKPGLVQQQARAAIARAVAPPDPPK